MTMLCERAHVLRMGMEMIFDWVIQCRMDDDRLTFKPGQFAFVRFANTQDPHPFSIASSDTDPRTISFCVKVLGDDTLRLMQSLAILSLLREELLLKIPLLQLICPMA